MLDRPVELPSVEICETLIGSDRKRYRIELGCTRICSVCLVKFSPGDQGFGVPVMGRCVVRVQLDRLFEFFVCGIRVPFLIECHVRQHRVSFTEGWIYLDRLERRGLSLF